MIEASTGVFTGSIFNDTSILKAGHLGEFRDFLDGSTIMQKTHHHTIYTRQYYPDKVITGYVILSSRVFQKKCWQDYYNLKQHFLGHPVEC